MISKESFVNCIDAIEKFSKEEERLYSETGGTLCLYENDALNHMVSSFNCFMSNYFDDDNDWIGYYMWELNFGKDNDKLKVYEKDGSEIPLKNASDLYDLLIKNRESRTNSDEVIESGN